jgi:hypothetical protein
VLCLITSVRLGCFGNWLDSVATRLIRCFFSCLILWGSCFSRTTLANDNTPLHIGMQLAMVRYRPCPLKVDLKGLSCLQRPCVEQFVVRSGSVPFRVVINELDCCTRSNVELGRVERTAARS